MKNINYAIYPFPFKVHLIFAIISLIFFAFQYYRLRYKYHLILAIFIPFSLLIYVANTKFTFYMIGFVELAALIACIVTLTVERKKLEAQHSISETITDITSDEVSFVDISPSEETGFIDLDDSVTTENADNWLKTAAGESDTDDKSKKTEIPNRAGLVDMDFLNDE